MYQITKEDADFFDKIHTLPQGEWFIIDDNRPDKDVVIERFKKFIDTFDRGEFSSDYKKFRLTLSFQEQLSQFKQS